MFDLVVIGASRGGVQAVAAILRALPRNYPRALIVVQHRPRAADDTLVTLLQERCVLPVSEAQDKDPLVPGHVYLAPARYHLLVAPGSLALSTEEPVSFAWPSIDILFESAAWAYGTGVVGVLLTGASPDGAAGLVAIKSAGGLAVVQDPATAEAPAMPQAAIDACGVDMILPLDQIGPFLANLDI